MYGNMNSEKLSVPLDAEGKFVFDLSRSRKGKGARKIMALAGVAFLVVVNISLLVVTVQTLMRVKELESQMYYLKVSVADIQTFQDEIIGFVGSENDDQYEDTEEKTDAAPEIYIESEDYPATNSNYDYYYDPPNETKEAYNDMIENLKLATNLTKDGKVTSKTKRDVVAATQDGVLINSESYAERKARNGTRRRHMPRGHSITAYPAQSSSFGSSPWESSQGIGSEASTAVDGSTTHTKLYRRTGQVVKKSFLRSADSFGEDMTPSPDFTVFRRRYRQRNFENYEENRTRMGRAKLPAIHYSGDTSKYVVGQHTNFNGNGHLKHPQRTFVDWRVSDWASSAGMDDFFTMDEGVLRIKETGLYFIYAQVYYLDEHDTTGFRVHKNSHIILQCTITIHAREKKLIGNTCYTAGVEYLTEGDTISLADVTDGRYSLFEPGKSFFGLIKINDLKI